MKSKIHTLKNKITYQTKTEIFFIKINIKKLINQHNEKSFKYVLKSIA